MFYIFIIISIENKVQRLLQYSKINISIIFSLILTLQPPAQNRICRQLHLFASTVHIRNLDP